MQLTIQADTPSSLVAVQGAQASSSMVWVWTILAAVFFVAALRTRVKAMLLVPVLFAVFAVLAAFWPKTERSYRMALNYQAGTVLTEELINGNKGSEQSVALADVASAEMQYNRDATRIALILRNGEQRFPLGQYHFTKEPDQYVILTKIRSAIGQTAPEGK